MPRRHRLRTSLAICTGLFWFATRAVSVENANKLPGSSALNSLVGQYCADCHSSDLKKGDLDLESIGSAAVNEHTELWEKVARRLRTRQMPPAGKQRPDEKTYDA